MKALSVLTLLAILVGPIAAVLVTRFIDAKRDTYNRKMRVFRTLMRTRQQPTSPQHVEALNLIEIEFSGCENVIDAFKALFQHLGTHHQRLPLEEVNANTAPAEAIRRNAQFDTRIGNERQTLLAILLHAISKEMKFRIEQLENFAGGYMPQGWVDAEVEHKVIRKYVTDLYTGSRVVPVGVVDYTTAPPANRQDTT